MKRFMPSIVLWLVFETIAIVLWRALGNLFYLMNFSYIGTCLAVGVALYACGWRHARRFVQFAVGSYMLVYLGLIQRENMQIEGFWYYLFLGVFEGATIHYLVAKIAGPAVFGRGWCGYACWTAMVLDLLPWKTSPGRKGGLGWIRYALLAASLAFVGATTVLGVASDVLFFVAFVVGNVAYYAAGIGLAAALEDNRAFCKYLCPVGVLMKPAAYVSLMRVTCDAQKCVSCGRCKRACPMDVDMTDNSRTRVNGTECILCGQCIDACPAKALKL
jgi:polyferredoxin